jgi:hypothetical protein
MTGVNDLLCLLCRKHGHGAIGCPQAKANKPSINNHDPFTEAMMLETLRTLPNSLCQRCEQYNIIKVSQIEHIVDTLENGAHIDSINQTANTMTTWLAEKQKHNLVLGTLDSISLYGSCPLCRLIYRVFPVHGADIDNLSAVYYLRPFPSYDRQSTFLKETDATLKDQYAIYFSIESEEKAMGNIMEHFADTDGQMVGRVQESFTLSSESSIAGRGALRSRSLKETIDFALPRWWLETCVASHGASCRRTWSDELLATKMIDIQTRQVVQCRPNAEYVALSYVWGNVKPADDALQNRTLPQTIEDAIVVTHQLGKRFLWVQHSVFSTLPRGR